MATSEDVAQLAGVSRATVSRVLNGSARISEEARARVHAAMTTLEYEPDVVAQSLVRRRSRMIALSLLDQEDGSLSRAWGKQQTISTLTCLGVLSKQRPPWGMICFFLPDRVENIPKTIFAAFRCAVSPERSC